MIQGSIYHIFREEGRWPGFEEAYRHLKSLGEVVDRDYAKEAYNREIYHLEKMETANIIDAPLWGVRTNDGGYIFLVLRAFSQLDIEIHLKSKSLEPSQFDIEYLGRFENVKTITMNYYAPILKTKKRKKG